MDNQPNNNNKKMLPIIIIGVAAVIVIGVVAYLLLSNNNNSSSSEKDVSNVSGYIVADGADPELTTEEIQALLQKKVDESKIAFSVYTEPTFEEGKGELMFVNPVNNAHNIDFVVTLDDSKKTVIKLDKIAPDQYIKDVTLLEDLAAGEYAATGMVTGYDKVTGSVVGQVAVEMLIKVK
jgi:hypothetical protein